MLMLETDEKGHVGWDPDYRRNRQKEQENCGYYLIRTDPDKKDFSDYEEFGGVSACITESIKKTLKNQLKVH